MRSLAIPSGYFRLVQHSESYLALFSRLGGRSPLWVRLRSDIQFVKSALPLEADIPPVLVIVGFVPIVLQKFVEGR
jgi:hypothetical protein